MTPLDLLVGSVLWLLATGGIAWAAPAVARRWMPRSTWPTGELFLRSTLVATLSILSITALAGFIDALGRTSLLAGAAAVTALGGWLRRKEAPARKRRRRVPWAGAALPWRLAGAVVAVDTLLALPKPPSSWDAMTYHLFLPARWLQEGRIFHVPTVFFDNVAAFSPQNGALLHLWQMALSGGDALTTAAQGLFVLTAAAALYRLALELGAPRHAAAWVAPPAVLLVPARAWGYTANVDVFMATFAVAGLAWTVAYRRRGERGDLLAASLAAGLAAGSKTAGLVIAAGLLTTLAAATLYRSILKERTPRAAALALAVSAAAATLAGGYWYFRNWALFGNPLFPLDFGIGPLRFAGAYTSDALRGSFLHVDWPLWTKTVDITVGRLSWILALLAAGLGAVTARRDHRLGAVTVMGLAAFWVYFCYAIQPYNNQTRFLIPGLWLALVGWAPAIARLAGRRRRTIAGLTVAGVSWLATTPQVAWRTRVAQLQDAGVELTPIVLAGLAPLLFGLWALRQGATPGRSAVDARRLAAGSALMLLAVPVLVLAGVACERARAAFYARADFRLYAPGYLFFTDPSLPPSEVAYSGFSMPYVLMGPGWRHRVQYVETPSDAGSSFYDYWRRDPQRHASHKPGIYRRADDRPGPWLDRVEHERVDYVALFAPFPVELPGHWPLDGTFPIERRWLRDSGRASPVVRSDNAEVWRLERRDDR
ncbi:MAG: hypothetical protein AAGM22_06840 [Acidobacteriota bacterium]